jgi:hypothetical protein
MSRVLRCTDIALALTSKRMVGRPGVALAVRFSPDFGSMTAAPQGLSIRLQTTPASSSWPTASPHFTHSPRSPHSPHTAHSTPSHSRPPPSPRTPHAYGLASTHTAQIAAAANAAAAAGDAHPYVDDSDSDSATSNRVPHPPTSALQPHPEPNSVSDSLLSWGWGCTPDTAVPQSPSHPPSVDGAQGDLIRGQLPATTAAVAEAAAAAAVANAASARNTAMMHKTVAAWTRKSPAVQAEAEAEVQRLRAQVVELEARAAAEAHERARQEKAITQLEGQLRAAEAEKGVLEHKYKYEKELLRVERSQSFLRVRARNAHRDTTASDFTYQV